MIGRNTAMDPDTHRELVSFVRIFSILGFLVLVVFGLQHILTGENSLLGLTEVIGGCVLAINFIGLYFTKNVFVTRTILLIAVASFLMIMLLTGGLGGTGIFWFYLFPILAFFITGRVGGAIWIAGLYVATITLYLLSLVGFVQIPYSGIEVRQLLISLFVLSFSVYIYQHSRETAHSSSRQSKKDVQAERGRAEAIVRNIGEGIVATDQQNNVTFMNRAAEELIGWWEHDLIGKKFTQVVKIDQVEKGVDIANWPLGKNKGSEEAYVTTARYKRKDGTQILLEVKGVPIIVNGESIGSVASLRDVAEYRSIDLAKSEFMTVASHQLRTPISAISWFAEMLLNGDAGKLTSEQKEDVEQIYQSNLRMAKLVGGMLVVSSLELGNIPVSPEPTDMAKISHKILKEQLASLSEKDLPNVKEHYSPDLPKVNVDTDIIKMILQNLIGNALKYTPKDGSVSIEIARFGKKDEISIIISDSGYGIPKNARSSIFSKFFRAENIRSKDTDGTGLGLYIVKSLLDYVGGSISFTSEENQGTTFVVRLPEGGMKKP